MLKNLISPFNSIWYYYFDFLNISNGLQGYFNTIILETTTYCNRRCSYCPNSISDRGLKKNEIKLDIEDIKSIVDQLVSINFNGKFLPHFYGEPLLDDRLFDIVSYIKLKRPKSIVDIHTNGDYLNSDIFEKLINAKVDGLIITNHSPQNKNLELKGLISRYKKHLNIEYRNGDQLSFYNRRSNTLL